jgi:hypothetical protein
VQIGASQHGNWLYSSQQALKVCVQLLWLLDIRKSAQSGFHEVSQQTTRSRGKPFLLNCWSVLMLREKIFCSGSILQMLLHYSTHKVFNSHDQLFSNYETSTVVSHLELTCKWATVSPINPWSDMQETLLPMVLQLLRHCWCSHMTLPYSCIIQVFIAVAWQQTR